MSEKLSLLEKIQKFSEDMELYNTLENATDNSYILNFQNLLLVSDDIHKNNFIQYFSKTFSEKNNVMYITHNLNKNKLFNNKFLIFDIDELIKIQEFFYNNFKYDINKITYFIYDNCEFLNQYYNRSNIKSFKIREGIKDLLNVAHNRNIKIIFLKEKCNIDIDLVKMCNIRLFGKLNSPFNLVKSSFFSNTSGKKFLNLNNKINDKNQFILYDAWDDNSDNARLIYLT